MTVVLLVHPGHEDSYIEWMRRETARLKASTERLDRQLNTHPHVREDGTIVYVDEREKWRERANSIKRTATANHHTTPPEEETAMHISTHEITGYIISALATTFIAVIIFGGF